MEVRELLARLAEIRVAIQCRDPEGHGALIFASHPERCEFSQGAPKRAGCGRCAYCVRPEKGKSCSRQ